MSSHSLSVGFHSIWNFSCPQIFTCWNLTSKTTYVKSFCYLLKHVLSLLNSKAFGWYIFFKYIWLIMLLQPSYSFPLLSPSALHPPSHQHSISLSSCPWVVNVNPWLLHFLWLLTSHCLFFTYQLCFLFPVTSSPILSLPLQTDIPTVWSSLLWFCSYSSCLFSFCFCF